VSKVSVIILAFNQEDFITKAIQSVLIQKVNFPVELIISNDCSTDKTDSLIREIITNLPNDFEVVYTNHTVNIGATPNFYDALKKVSGKYLAFCEGDDYWTDENKLQVQYDFLEQNFDYAMCFHSVLNISPDQKLTIAYFQKWRIEIILYKKSINIG